jgi:ribonuclease G
VEEILINVTPQETRVAITAAGVVQELLIERSASRGLVGNIYAGRVARVLPGMQSAFVDIGLERAAFLHVADIWERKNTPIEQTLAEGQPLLVQVVKDPIGSKGARLSTQVSIAGRLLVYLPQDPHIGISQKIEDENGRAALRERLKELVAPDEKGGFILRTLAGSASEDELRSDLAYLKQLWKAIHERSLGAEPPKLLYQDLSLAQRVLRDMVSGQTARVVIDSRENFQKLSAFAGGYMPQVRERLEHYTGERPLFDLYNIEPEIERALSRRVDLTSGGTLVIDQTEAMTTIDVNTGGFVGSRNFDDTVFKTNLEAAQAIARQLRLRNLGGIIIVDFIDMESAEHRSAVLDELRRAIARDRTRVTLNGFTALGLVELTRKRTRESLAHVLCEPCPTCDGRGEVKTAHTVCYEILREILRADRQFNPNEYRILAPQKVNDLVLDEEAAS